MLYRLISTEGDQSFDLRPGPALVVGRALSSDLPVLDPTISRRHAELVCDGEGVRVRDLASSNGTFVNGQKVDSAQLSPGDVITFGKVAFRLREMAPTPQQAATPTSVAPPHPSTPLPGSNGPGRDSLRPGATILRQLPVRDPKQPLLVPFRASGAQAVGPESSTPPEGTEHDRNAQKLAKLLEVSTGLTRAVYIDALLEKIADFSFEIFDVDRVSVILMSEQDELLPKVSRDRRGTQAGRMVPQSILRTAIDDKVAIISDNAPEDQRFGGHSILVQRVRSAMCAPLVGSEERVLGALYVDNLTTTHRFLEEDLEYLIAFANIAAVAIENSQFSERIRHEMLVRSNFERYFAPSLAARIASSPDAIRLGGDKRHVAVLFSDIRGFTTLSESMRPDDMASLLTEYFTEMVECVFRNGGTLDKFIGDAVMAQWGAPIGSPDDADNAMRAATEMIEELRKLNAKWRAAGRPELEIGIGLNYGEAFAGNIGSERRLEFTVIGDTVNTASRLCSAAEGNEILISQEMRDALTNAPPLAERAALEVKGKSQPVPIYSVRA